MNRIIYFLIELPLIGHVLFGYLEKLIHLYVATLLDVVEVEQLLYHIVTAVAAAARLIGNLQVLLVVMVVVAAADGVVE